MSRRRLLIHGGLLVDPASGIEARRDLLFSGGRVEAVSPRIPVEVLPAGVQRVDASGCWVLPGLIDMHVHLREPGGEADETLESGTLAAAAGGVTTVLAMPNTRPVTDSPARLRALLDRVRRDAKVRVLPVAAVTVGQGGRRLAPLRRLAEAGAAAFSDDGRPIVDDDLFLAALSRAKALGLPLLEHAEDPELSAGGVVHEGRTARRLGVPGIPAAAEVFMAMRDISLAEVAGAPLHLCHVSCERTVELVRSAKRRGVRVSAEATPHHFTLTGSDIPADDADFKMNPPLRDAHDRDALLEGLADGTIDAIATDHAPHRASRKAAGLRKAPFGVIGLQTLLPLTLALVARGVLSRSRMARLLSAGPAAILGLKDRGRLRPGDLADAVVVDPRASWTPRRFLSKSRNSPFLGRRLKGLSRATVVGGRVVFSREAHP